ncbi:MAG TPA: RNA-binding protein [Myxococcota bacterium]|nr:RNA-binding protein [Myxococcota bacterium]
MRDLAEHLLKPLLAHADELHIRVIEGESVTILEAVVHADDRAELEADDSRTLRAIRTVLSAAAGREKATLDLVDSFDAPAASAEE